MSDLNWDGKPKKENDWFNWYNIFVHGGILDMAALNNVDYPDPVISDAPIKPSYAERQVILNAMDDRPGVREKIQGEGFYVNNIRYVFIRVDDDRLFGKKGKDGLLCYRIKDPQISDHLLIGHHTQDVSTVTAAAHLESSGDTLKNALAPPSK